MRIHDAEQRSIQWYALRAGLPTASEFSKILTGEGAPSKSRLEYARILAGDMYAKKQLDHWTGGKWTDRGVEMEEDAKSHYVFVHDCETDEVGFVTDDDVTYGCSPDLLVGARGLLEIKCQMSKEHIKTMLYWQKHKRCPPGYYSQVQGQLMVCERQWCDLLFYHDAIPPFEIRITRDDEFIAALQDGIMEVIQERNKILTAIRKQAG